MSISAWIRQVHRWLSIIFTITVIANFAVLSMNEQDRPMWIIYSPLIPLFLLMCSGLYMFALPHITKWRGNGHAGVQK
ncbi:hypothetical protein [Phyllobacterium sp. K27]